MSEESSKKYKLNSLFTKSKDSANTLLDVSKNVAIRIVEKSKYVTNNIIYKNTIVSDYILNILKRPNLSGIQLRSITLADIKILENKRLIDFIDLKT